MSGCIASPRRFRCGPDRERERPNGATRSIHPESFVIPTDAYPTSLGPTRHESLPTVTGPVTATLPSLPIAVVLRVAHWLRILLHILTVALGLGTVLATIAAVRGIVAYGDWMYTDAVLLHAAMRVRDGLSIYPDVSKPPFLFLHYGPLYPLAIGLISRVADLGLLETLYLARILTVLTTVVAAASIVGLTAVCGASRTGALVAAAFFVTAYVIHPWAYVARTDLPALGATLLGLFVLLRWSSMSAAAIAGLLLAVGFECKQTYAVGVVAVVLSLILQRQWTRAVVVATVWIALVGLITFTMTWLTDGRYLEQAFGNNMLPVRMQTAWKYVSQYVPNLLALIVLAGIGLIAPGATGSASTTVRVYTCLAVVSGLVAVARMGSSYNYFIEATALLSISAGVGFDRARSLVDDAIGHLRSRLRASLMVAAVPLAIVAVGMFALTLRYVAFVAIHSPNETGLIETLRDASGPVLTARHGLAVMLAHKEPIAGDPIGIASITLGGRWDPTPLHEMVRTQAFVLIALDLPAEEVPERDGFPWWPPGTVELVREHYAYERRLGHLYLYVPNATPSFTPRTP